MRVALQNRIVEPAIFRAWLYPDGVDLVLNQAGLRYCRRKVFITNAPIFTFFTSSVSLNNRLESRRNSREPDVSEAKLRHISARFHYHSFSQALSETEWNSRFMTSQS